MQVRVCEEPKPRKGMCKAIHKWEMSVSWEPARAKSKQKKQGPRVVSCMLVGDAASCSTEVLGQVKSRPCPPPPRKWEAPCMLYFCSAVPPLVCLSMSCPSGKLLQWLQGLHHVSPLKPSVSLGAGWLPGKFLHAHASRLLTMTVSPLHVPSRKVKLCSCLGSNPGSANY